jgi:transcriptional regulator with XRE-family HTH domain
MFLKVTIYGDRLKEIRKFFGDSQKKFSERTGIGRTYIAAIEIGRKELSFSFLQKLVDTIGLSPTWLMTGEGEMFLTKDTLKIAQDVNNNQISLPEITTDTSPLNQFALTVGLAKEMGNSATHDDRIRAAKFLKWAIEELEAAEVERSAEQRFDGAAG